MIRTRRANNQMNNTTMVVLCCISFVTVWYKYGTQNGVYFGYTATEMITIKITKLDNREVIVTVKFNNQIKALIDQHRFEWQSTMTLNYELIYGTVIGNSFKFRPSFGISGDSLEILCIGDTETMLFIWKLIAENYKIPFRFLESIKFNLKDSRVSHSSSFSKFESPCIICWDSEGFFESLKYNSKYRTFLNSSKFEVREPIQNTLDFSNSNSFVTKLWALDALNSNPRLETEIVLKSFQDSERPRFQSEVQLKIQKCSDSFARKWHRASAETNKERTKEKKEERERDMGIEVERQKEWPYFWEGYSDGMTLHQTVLPRAAWLDAGRNANLRNSCSSRTPPPQKSDREEAEGRK